MTIQFVNPLHRPTGFHELDGQPVKQLGMGRRLALRAEVTQRSRQCRAPPQLSPPAIDGHSCGKGVISGRQPSSQTPAVGREHQADPAATLEVFCTATRAPWSENNPRRKMVVVRSDDSTITNVVAGLIAANFASRAATCSASWLRTCVGSREVVNQFLSLRRGAATRR